MTTQPSTIACDLTVFATQERKIHMANARRLFAAVEETREMSDGYMLRLPVNGNIIAQIADFIAQDRLCCPFVRFGMVVEPHGGPIWLQLTGDEAVKTYLAGELACLIEQS